MGVVKVIAVCSMACTAVSAGSEPTTTTALETKASGPTTFYCDDRAGNNQVTVFSESTLEDFTSVCNRVAGKCVLDPKRVESFSGRFSIRAEDLKTGMDLRDHHLVGPDWLDAAQYPEIVVQIDKVEEVRKTAATTASLVLVGTCSLHGKNQPVRIPANLTYLDETPETMRRVKGDLLRIRANFDVKLADYGLTGPPGSDWIGLKVAETVRIKVTVFGSTERPADPLKVDRPESPGEGPPPSVPRPPPPPKKP
jgi:polyisoprenoid-binding protein YceI